MQKQKQKNKHLSKPPEVAKNFGTNQIVYIQMIQVCINPWAILHLEDTHIRWQFYGCYLSFWVHSKQIKLFIHDAINRSIQSYSHSMRYQNQLNILWKNKGNEN